MSWQRLLGPLDRLPTEGSLEDWHAAALARADGLGTLERAVLGGRLAASPGLAFLAGYQAALRALWPAAPEGLGALCVTGRHGSLVPVSSTHRCAYTPGLSTSSSSTFLQDSQGVRENSSRGKFRA